MAPRSKSNLPPEPNTRQRLLAGATRVFSRLGFESATTRTIAEEAGVNLASIPYYFGTKEALYQEVIAALCASFNLKMGPRVSAVHTLLKRQDAGPADWKEALCDLVEDQVVIVLSEDMIQAVPILAREQERASVSPILEEVYQEVLHPALDLAATLLGRLYGEDPGSAPIRVKAYALMGMGVHIASARQSFRLYVGQDLEGEAGFALVRQCIRDLVAGALPPTPPRSRSHTPTTQEC